MGLLDKCLQMNLTSCPDPLTQPIQSFFYNNRIVIGISLWLFLLVFLILWQPNKKLKNTIELQEDKNEKINYVTPFE